MGQNEKRSRGAWALAPPPWQVRPGRLAAASPAYQVPDAEQDGAGADMATQAATVGVEPRPGRDHLHRSGRGRRGASARPSLQEPRPRHSGRRAATAGSQAAPAPAPLVPARLLALGPRSASPASAPSGCSCRTLCSEGGGRGRSRRRRGGLRGT